MSSGWRSRTSSVEVVQDVAMAARERGTNASTSAASRSDRAASWSRRPSPPSVSQGTWPPSGMSAPIAAAKQVRRLGPGEAEVGGPELPELAAHPETGQGQRRIGPAGDDHPHAGGSVLHAGTGWMRGCARRRWRGSRRGRWPGSTGSSLSSLISAVTTPSSDSATPEQSPTRSMSPGTARSMAAARWRQNRAGSLSPGSSESQATGPSRCATPVGEQSGLAESRRGADECDASVRPVIQLVDQALAGHEPRLHAWDMELRREQRPGARPAHTC